MPVRILAFAALVAAAALAVVAAANPVAPGIRLVSSIAPAALTLEFKPSMLATPFLALLALVVPAVALWGLRRGAPADGFRITLFVLAMIAVVLAQTVAAFFLAWETMSLVSAFLVGVHHERRDVRRALFSYIVVSQLGALCILAALAVLGMHAASFRFTDIAHAAPNLSLALRSSVLALALVGFGSKAGLVPLHFWLPRAHPVAPANASALLSGIMLKVAVYGLLLVCFELAAPTPIVWGAAITIAGLLAAFAGALYAAVDADFKRLLAYSSIENIGIIVATLGLATVAATLKAAPLEAIALSALLYHTVSHGTFKSLLFLSAGNVAGAAHTTDLDHLGGLYRTLPFTSPAVFVGCIAASALPPLTGFASEWLVFASFIAALATGIPWVQLLAAAAIVVLACASGLAGLAFAKLFGIAFLGRSRTTHEVQRERPDESVLGLGWLALACVAFGVAPAFVLEPLRAIAATLISEPALAVTILPVPPVAIAAWPVLAVVAAYVLTRWRGVHYAPTWTCGSLVTPRSQYTATTFSKPIRRIFGFVLFPDRQKTSDLGTSRWFPTRIRYEMSTRDLVDEVMRNIAAFVQRFARRARIVQAGLLRIYLVYAVVAVLVIIVLAR